MEEDLEVIIGSRTQGCALTNDGQLTELYRWMNECTKGLDCEKFNLNTFELVFHREEDMDATSKFLTKNGWVPFGLAAYVDCSGNRVRFEFDHYMNEIVKIATIND